MSEEEKKESPENVNTGEKVPAEEPVTRDDEAAGLVAEWETKYNEINDKYIRLYSEFDNFKRRTAREKTELIKVAGAEIVKTVLPTLDDFERAIKANEKSEDAAALREGFRLIHNKLMAALEAQGVKKMEVLGADLDTDLHEAITQIPAPDEKLKGKIVDVVENGYFMNEHVIRYAKVVMGS